MSHIHHCNSCLYSHMVRPEIDMDDFYGIFGVRYTEDDLIELYMEDAGTYHLRATFHKFWLADLKKIVEHSL